MTGRSLLEHTNTIPECRQSAKCTHNLSEVVFMALCAMMCGFDSWSEIALFAEERERWFRRWLTLPGGIPSHDTFNRIFAILPASELKRVFQGWLSDVLENRTISGQIAVDGKALRSTAKGRGKCAATHMVNAWSTEMGLCLGQCKVKTKSNEGKAIPTLLEMLELAGCLVSIDAAGTYQDNAEIILGKGGDYLFAAKDNQSNLTAEITAQFDALWQTVEVDVPGPCFSETHERGHGRTERRRCWVLPVTAAMPLCRDWRAKTIVAVQAERSDGKQGHDFVRFFLTSRAMDAATALAATRNHWAVENQLHWTLDIAFNEDNLGARVGHAAENLAVLRQWILNILKQNTSRKLSMANKRKLCCLNEDYLFECMGLFNL